MSDMQPLPLDRQAIQAILPHRDPMLFVDRVLEYDETHIRAEADIREDAPYFAGHFPEMPIMPGVLIMETIAQTAALLIGLTSGLPKNRFLALAHIAQARFRRPVYPNETISVEVEIVNIRRHIYKFRGDARVGSDIVAQPEFTAAAVAFDRN